MTTSEQLLRVGVVGVGYLGRFHAEKYTRMPGVDLAGIADADFDRAADVAATNKTEAFQDYRDLVGRIEAVSIVVPTPLHYSIAKFFLSRQVDVMIEKPMTSTLAEADELIELAESEERIVQVGHLERFNPAVVAVKDQLDRPEYIESRRLCIYNERGTDVSVVLDLMIHDIDIILSFVGSSVCDIRATGFKRVAEHDDYARARLEFENGCTADLTASRIETQNERTLRLFQPNAIIDIDYANRKTSVARPAPGNRDALIPGMQIENGQFPDGDALADELGSFVTAVRMRMMPEVTGRMGRDALAVALQIMKRIEASKRQC